MIRPSSEAAMAEGTAEALVWALVGAASVSTCAWISTTEAAKARAGTMGEIILRDLFVYAERRMDTTRPLATSLTRMAVRDGAEIRVIQTCTVEIIAGRRAGTVTRLERPLFRI